MTEKINIYCPNRSPRLTYILDELLVRQMGAEYVTFHEFELFKRAAEPKINYSNQVYDNAINIKPGNLLFEKNIEVKEIVCTKWNETPVIFPTNNNEFPFDIFAASFYLLSRYEEYLPSQMDKYGRYLAENSILNKCNLIHKPIINIWIYLFKKEFLAKYSTYCFPVKKFEYTPTIDIDNAFAFQNKGVFRTLGGILKNLTGFKFDDLKTQVNVLTNKKPDPFDTFDDMTVMHKKYAIKPIYFFLVGNFSRHDTNISIKNKTFRDLIRKQLEVADIGMHPSTKSHLNIKRVREEKSRLEETLDFEITKSRNHFLLLKLPESYEILSELEIKDDYSMGYSEINGFRAGISTPFKFYNLKREKAEDLTIHPFAFMDATSYYYLNQGAEQALAEMKQLSDEVKAVNGNLISLWHNETLSNFRQWQGWNEKYDQLLEHILK